MTNKWGVILAVIALLQAGPVHAITLGEAGCYETFLKDVTSLYVRMKVGFEELYKVEKSIDDEVVHLNPAHTEIWPVTEARILGSIKMLQTCIKDLKEIKDS